MWLALRYPCMDHSYKPLSWTPALGAASLLLFRRRELSHFFPDCECELAVMTREVASSRIDLGLAEVVVRESARLRDVVDHSHDRSRACVKVPVYRPLSSASSLKRNFSLLMVRAEVLRKTRDHLGLNSKLTGSMHHPTHNATGVPPPKNPFSYCMRLPVHSLHAQPMA